MSLTTKEVCICDQCGRERNKDTNHWWLILPSLGLLDISGTTAVMMPMSGRDVAYSFILWNDIECRKANAKHLCGRACLYKAIDKLAQEILQQERVKA